MQHKKHRTPWTLYAIFLSFLVPIVVAYSLFFSGYRTTPVNRGTLIASPYVQIPIKDLTKSKTWSIAWLNTHDTMPSNLETISKRWAALGKERHRVRLENLTGAQSTHGTTSSIWAPNHLPDGTLNRLTRMKTSNGQPCRYFLVDPERRAILCYEQSADPKDIDMDLRKLLKYSRSG